MARNMTKVQWDINCRILVQVFECFEMTSSSYQYAFIHTLAIDFFIEPSLVPNLLQSYCWCSCPWKLQGNHLSQTLSQTLSFPCPSNSRKRSRLLRWAVNVSVTRLHAKKKVVIGEPLFPTLIIGACLLRLWALHTFSMLFLTCHVTQTNSMQGTYLHPEPFAHFCCSTLHQLSLIWSRPIGLIWCSCTWHVRPLGCCKTDIEGM